jgi:uncharacterized UBP type Zn finger protein
MTACTHLYKIQNVTPGSQGCENCIAIGDTWLHLRLCMTCGHVGCCDSSKNKHASAHAGETGHPIVQSFEPGEDWFWCYVDEVAFLVEDAPSLSYVAGDTGEIRRII